MSDVKENTKAPKTDFIKKVVAPVKPALPVIGAFVAGTFIGVTGTLLWQSWSGSTEFATDADVAVPAE